MTAPHQAEAEVREAIEYRMTEWCVLDSQDEIVATHLPLTAALDAYRDAVAARVRADTLAEVTKEFERNFPEQAEHDSNCNWEECVCDQEIRAICVSHNQARTYFLAALARLTPTEGPTDAR